MAAKLFTKISIDGCARVKSRLVKNFAKVEGCYDKELILF